MAARGPSYVPATPPRCRPHCLTHHERVEWLALSRLRYLTNLTNSRVRSTHPFHTKSPFSRFGGGRRQKSENIIVSARGRRRPQAPTLRISGCANARKYDYKSSSPSIGGARALPRWPAEALRAFLVQAGACQSRHSGVGGFMINVSSASVTDRKSLCRGLATESFLFNGVIFF